MPTTDGPSPEIRAEILDLLQACTRLAALQHRIAGNLHTLGLLDNTTHLAVIARSDQIDAHIDQARTNLTSGNTDPDTTPHRIPTTRLAA